MKRILLVVAMMMMLVGNAWADTGKDAVRALSKLEARCEAGISYRDFAPAIGDAKFDVNMFLQSQEAKDKPELTESIEKVMSHYMSANTIWTVKFTWGTMADFVPISNDTVESFLIKYPEVNKNIDDGGIVTRIMFVKSANIEAAAQYAINQASKELKTAMMLLVKPQETGDVKLDLKPPRNDPKVDSPRHETKVKSESPTRQNQ
ncbi:MAG: hypothetical protein HIU83_03695 [Proteobacteria bacterium]|nr:hypothetical protein [Pseudomonadota bacterium]